MKSEDKFVYWDSCLFLAFLNDENGKADLISELYEKVEKENGKILTSTLAIVEVAHASSEKNNFLLDPEIQNEINQIWADSKITTIEVNQDIAETARQIIREYLPKQWALTTQDAIHLATAVWINRNVAHLKEFLTFDQKLFKYQTQLGFHIKEPYILQPKLVH